MAWLFVLEALPPANRKEKLAVEEHGTQKRKGKRGGSQKPFFFLQSLERCARRVGHSPKDAFL